MENGRMGERRRILRATAIAGVAAGVILVAAVLPAEYGIDPLRTGKVIGLTALSGSTDATSTRGTAPITLEAVRPGVNSPQSGGLGQDQFVVELRPFEGVEYKYRMEKGATMVYSWQATEKVAYEFHGEPDGAPAKYFESYDKAENTNVDGMFVAPTAGIHGWYWKNLGVSRVTVTLKTSGFYGPATEFRDGNRIIHEPTRR